jgi:hypothetical protein
MQCRINGIKQNVERTIAAALPSHIANQNLSHSVADLFRSRVAYRQTQMRVSSKELSLVDLINFHLSLDEQE